MKTIDVKPKLDADHWSREVEGVYIGISLGLHNTVHYILAERGDMCSYLIWNRRYLDELARVIER